MISYAPLWKTMKEKGVSQYKLIKDYGVDPAQLHRLRKNMVIKTVTVDKLCSVLNCKVEDVMEYIPE